MMKNGLILEDHSEAQKWLSSVLRQAFPGIEISIFDCLEDSLESVNHSSFDIALIDLNLPDGSGIELIEKINQKSPATCTVVTTIYDDDAHLFPALKAGVNGYLLKEQSQVQLIKLLKGIINGEPPISPSISRRMLNFFSSSHGDESGQQSNNLTKREQDVLKHIAKGWKLSEVAKELNLSRNTVATHVKNIYSKLHISTRAEAATAAAQLGVVDS